MSLVMTVGHARILFSFSFLVESSCASPRIKEKERAVSTVMEVVLKFIFFYNMFESPSGHMLLLKKMKETTSPRLKKKRKKNKGFGRYFLFFFYGSGRYNPLFSSFFFLSILVMARFL